MLGMKPLSCMYVRSMPVGEPNFNVQRPGQLFRNSEPGRVRLCPGSLEGFQRSRPPSQGVNSWVFAAFDCKMVIFHPRERSRPPPFAAKQKNTRIPAGFEVAAARACVLRHRVSLGL